MGWSLSRRGLGTYTAAWCGYNWKGLWNVQQLCALGIFRKATPTHFSFFNVLQKSFTSFLCWLGFQIVGEKNKRKKWEWWTVVMCFSSQAWNWGSSQRSEFSLGPGQQNETPRTRSLDMSLPNKPKEMDDMMLTKRDEFWSIIYVNIN